MTAADSADSVSAAANDHNEEHGDAESRESDSEEDTDEEFSGETDAAQDHLHSWHDSDCASGTCDG